MTLVRLQMRLGCGVIRTGTGPRGDGAAVSSVHPPIVRPMRAGVHAAAPADRTATLTLTLALALTLNPSPNPEP